MKPDIPVFSLRKNTMHVSLLRRFSFADRNTRHKKTKSAKCLFAICIYCISIVWGAKAQETQNIPLPHIDRVINIDSLMRARQDDTSLIIYPGHDSIIARPKLIGDSAHIQPELPQPKKNYDDRWFISPGLRYHGQNYSIVKNNGHEHTNITNTLPFGKKNNSAFAVSVYRNLSKRVSVSGDIGMSFGHASDKSSLVTQTVFKTYNMANAELYYHFIDNKNKVQPFVSAGIYTLSGEATYTSAPLGVGFKYQGNGMMATAKIAYAYSISSNVSGINPLMYSVGVYLPLKKKKKEPAKNEVKNELKKNLDSTNTPAQKSNNNNLLTLGMPNINVFIMMPPFDGSTNKKNNGNSSDDGANNNDNNDNNGYNKNPDIRRQVRDGSPDNPFNYPPLSRYTIYFNYDLYSLTSTAFEVLDQVTYQLKTNSNLYVDLLGYTDLVASEAYNLPLSKKRAQVAFEYLKSRGISTDRMFVNYFGKENPVVNTTDPNASWRNRRTEIILYEKK